MGQSSSRYTGSTTTHTGSIRTVPSKHARRYHHSDDDEEDSFEIPKPGRRATSHRPEAQTIKSSSRPLRDTSDDTAPVSSRKAHPSLRPSKSVPVKKYSTLDRHYRYDETTSSHRHGVQAHLSSTPNSKSQHSESDPQTRQPRQKKECVICTSNRSLSRFPSDPVTVQCDHNSDVCRRCLRTWISTSFASKMWDEINCPVCSARLAYDDVREFASPEVFRTYRILSKKAAKEAIPGWHWCPGNGCKYGQVVGASNKLYCRKCKKTYCVEHNKIWHKGETCREYEYRTNKKLKKEEEKASKSLIKNISKSCPGCKRPIEKSYGCDHMTCSKCRHEFCWECQAPYLKKHEVSSVTHREDCIHFGDDFRVYRNARVRAMWDEYFLDR